MIPLKPSALRLIHHPLHTHSHSHSHTSCFSSVGGRQERAPSPASVVCTKPSSVQETEWQRHLGFQSRRDKVRLGRGRSQPPRQASWKPLPLPEGSAGRDESRCGGARQLLHTLGPIESWRGSLHSVLSR